MTKRDYIKIASAIVESTLQEHVSFCSKEALVRGLMHILWEDNNNFDRMRFWTACGLPPNEL